MTYPSRTVLLRELEKNFDKSELNTLAFKLGIDFENLAGDKKSDKARELIAYCERHGRYTELAAACMELRPHANWDNSDIDPLEDSVNKTGGSDFEDPYTYYEPCLKKLKAKLRRMMSMDDPQFIEVLNYERDLLNISRDRLSKDTRSLDEIISHLDALTKTRLGVSFDDLCS